ncbi:ashwin [Amyelois transitella]|uniref:ashwin n=1 Tax=Amyelois transitella TaxID=680683 RepID=UPI00067C781C|nr:ashwin [Amyelois transitella]
MAVPCEMLLHPELLSNEQLILIIQERHLRMPDMERLPRDELLEIFHHYCVPYGQRKYRDSGRGRILNKTRQTSPDPKTKLNSQINSQSRKLMHPWPSERLKPPPEVMSGHCKMIKLEAKFSSTTINNDSSKRKSSIESAFPRNESPPTKKVRNPITWP